MGNRKGNNEKKKRSDKLEFSAKFNCGGGAVCSTIFNGCQTEEREFMTRVKDQK